jgi:hypothetical protein
MEVSGSRACWLTEALGGGEFCNIRPNLPSAELPGKSEDRFAAPYEALDAILEAVWRKKCALPMSWAWPGSETVVVTRPFPARSKRRQSAPGPR